MALRLSAVWLLLLAFSPLESQTARKAPPFTPHEQAIATEMHGLRSLPDEQWRDSVGKLARQIHELPQSMGKVVLVTDLGNLVTEGDAGAGTLQTVATTMSDVLRAMPDLPLYPALARLVRYEHCQVSLDSPRYREALDKLKAEDEQRRNADFTLTDLAGNAWSLRKLRGKVVFVNFWATWCPPCRKEMPDLEELYRHFSPRGLVILAISDEDLDKVKPFVAAKGYTYPILLDPGRKVHQLFAVEGIPKTFVFNREGQLVAQAIDRRTRQQFLAMLKDAGLE